MLIWGFTYNTQHSRGGSRNQIYSSEWFLTVNSGFGWALCVAAGWQRWSGVGVLKHWQTSTGGTRRRVLVAIKGFFADPEDQYRGCPVLSDVCLLTWIKRKEPFKKMIDCQNCWQFIVCRLTNCFSSKLHSADCVSVCRSSAPSFLRTSNTGSASSQPAARPWERRAAWKRRTSEATPRVMSVDPHIVCIARTYTVYTYTHTHTNS